MHNFVLIYYNLLPFQLHNPFLQCFGSSSSNLSRRNSSDWNKVIQSNARVIFDFQPPEACCTEDNMLTVQKIYKLLNTVKSTAGNNIGISVVSSDTTKPWVFTIHGGQKEVCEFHAALLSEDDKPKYDNVSNIIMHKVKKKSVPFYQGR